MTVEVEIPDGSVLLGLGVAWLDERGAIAGNFIIEHNAPGADVLAARGIVGAIRVYGEKKGYAVVQEPPEIWTPGGNGKRGH